MAHIGEPQKTAGYMGNYAFTALQVRVRTRTYFPYNVRTEEDVARRVRSGSTDSRSARARLDVQREPYWTKIASGRFLGYRRAKTGGTWIARTRLDGKQHYRALGAADDHLDADGIQTLSFDQAQERARAWFAEMSAQGAGAKAANGDLTVADAIDAYVADYVRRAGKSLDRTQSRIRNHILPALGNVRVAELTGEGIEEWLHQLASAAPLARPKRDGAPQSRAFDARDPDQVRKRKLSANKSLSILKAALNLAFRRGRVDDDSAWRRVKPFRGVDTARIRFLTDEEARRIVHASPSDFRKIVQGALLSGARYGELRALKVADYDRDGRSIHIRDSKSGKPRNIYLTDEGAALFDGLVAGRPSDSLVFLRDDGRGWRHAEQARRMTNASAAARIDPPATFHILRHTYASRLARAGAPMAVIAAQLGHSDTRITEKHYAHLAPNYVSSTVRAAFGAMELGVDESNVASLAR
ncbi:MAG: tyrosine-type recombinase/integrase [Alphaproteobacteria bacterium]